LKRSPHLPDLELTMSYTTIFADLGVSITDQRDEDENCVKGNIVVRWQDSNGFPFSEWFAYADLATRKQELANAMIFAANEIKISE